MAGAWLCICIVFVSVITSTYGIDYSNLLESGGRLFSGQVQAETRAFINELLANGARNKLSPETWVQELELQRHRNRSYVLSPACRNSTYELIDSLEHMPGWLEQMLDATTKIESGLLSGNILWLGAYDQCKEVHAQTLTPTNSSQHPRPLFNGMPCSVVVNNVSSVQQPTTADGLKMGVAGLALGVCIPDVCTTEDSMHLVNQVFFALPADYQAISASCHVDEQYPLDAPAIGVLVMLSVIIAVLLCATCYDLIMIQYARSPTKNRGYVVNDDIGPDGDQSIEESAAEYKPVTQHSSQKEALAAAEGHRGMFAMLMIRLSMYSNAVKLLSTERSASSLDALHGIRFLSLTWVILGHTYIFSLSFMDNLLVLPDVVGGFAFQAILNALVSVDTFFVLSGTLVSYLLLKELKKKDGPRHINWAMFYFHRFWRLTPPYMIVLGVHTALFKYLGSGPWWSESGIEPDCPNSWWANLIYLNNLIPNHTGCMGWAWYLANDMQFYIVSPFFIVALYCSSQYHTSEGYITPLMVWSQEPQKPIVGYVLLGCNIVGSITVTATKTAANHYIPDLPAAFTGAPIYKTVGIILASTTIAGSIVATAVITKINNYPPEAMGSFVGLPMGNWFNDVYISPYCRVGPYMIGMLLGYVLFKTECKVRIKWYVAAICWALATATAMAVLYGLYGVANFHPLSEAGNAIYAGFHREAWAVAIAWLIFACLTGYGGPVNTLLSWRIWMPLSRLTFMAYLVHPIVIYWFYLSRKTPFHFDEALMVYLFLGHLCISYAVAFVCSLLFEAPMLGLEKVLLHKKKPKAEE